MNQVTLKAIPAMLAGCTMVMKPSEIAPLSRSSSPRSSMRPGCPPACSTWSTATAPASAPQLSTHPDVEMISFTGSTRAGIAITKAAADIR
jgi:aldehyde dehydrogenase (NAD+)